MWHLILFLHLAGVAVWIGGQATILIAAPVIRAHAGDRADETLGVIGRRFGSAAGIALAVVVATGLMQAHHLGWSLSAGQGDENYRIITEKFTLVCVIIVLTALHGVLGARVASGKLSPQWRTRIRWVSVVNLALGLVVLWLAAGLE